MSPGLICLTNCLVNSPHILQGPCLRENFPNRRRGGKQEYFLLTSDGRGESLILTPILKKFSVYYYIFGGEIRPVAITACLVLGRQSRMIRPPTARILNTLLSSHKPV